MIIQLPGEKNIQPNISFICSRLSDGKRNFVSFWQFITWKIETKYGKWDEDSNTKDKEWDEDSNTKDKEWDEDSNTKDKEWDEDKFQTYRVEVEEWHVTMQKLPNQLLTS